MCHVDMEQLWPLALIPHLADVLYTYVRDALGAFGVYLEDVLTFNSVDEVSTALLEYGVVWKGVAALRHGAIITSILWGDHHVFVIDRRMNKAGFTFIIAAALSFFGFIHSPALGIGFAAMSTPYTHRVSGVRRTLFPIRQGPKTS